MSESNGRPKRERVVDDIETLLSRETMDRSSPELWPGQIPGIGEYVSLRDDVDKQDKKTNEAWNRIWSTTDVRLMQQLSALSASNLIMEVKKLHDLAYQLGVDEANEMTRGKYLNIFQSKCQR